MKNFSQTKISELTNYQGSSKRTIKKFLRKIEKNQRNSINISNTIDKQRRSTPICVKIFEFKGLKREFKPDEEINMENKQNISNNENNRYYLRYF